MTSIQVTVSGAVGKQVFSSSRQAEICSVILSPSGANATVTIRDGNASGEVVLWAKTPSAQGSMQYEIEHKFTKGVHVKVLGANAQAYLIIN